MSGILFYDSCYLALRQDPRFMSGGATRQVIAWVEGLKSIGVRVKVAGAHETPDLFAGEPDTIIAYNPKSGVPKLRYLYIRIPGLVKAIRDGKTDYVYHGVPSPFSGLLALLTLSLRRKFVLRVSNDCFVDERAKDQFDLFRYALFRLGFSLADIVVCQNSYQANCLEQRYPGKVFKVANPFLGVIAEKPTSFEKRRFVAWIGIFQYQKNLPALPAIARSMPNVEFRVAGAYGKKLPDADQQALNELERLGNVEFTGFLDHAGILRLLDESRLLLNTSHYEGFSNTFLEAFSRGTPVCTSPQNDPGGIIQANRLGSIFQSSKDAPHALRNILCDADAFQSMSANCIQYMRTHHDLSQQALQFWRIIESRASLAVKKLK